MANDKLVLQKYINHWIQLIHDFGEFKSVDGFLTCNDEYIDMLNEKF